MANLLFFLREHSQLLLHSLLTVKLSWLKLSTSRDRLRYTLPSVSDMAKYVNALPDWDPTASNRTTLCGLLASWSVAVT